MFEKSIPAICTPHFAESLFQTRSRTQYPFHYSLHNILSFAKTEYPNYMLLFTLFKAIRLFFHPGNYFRIFTGSHHNRRHSILHSKSAFTPVFCSMRVSIPWSNAPPPVRTIPSVYNICSQFRRSFSQALRAQSPQSDW